MVVHRKEPVVNWMSWELRMSWEREHRDVARRLRAYLKETCCFIFYFLLNLVLSVHEGSCVERERSSRPLPIYSGHGHQGCS